MTASPISQWQRRPVMALSAVWLMFLFAILFSDRLSAQCLRTVNVSDNASLSAALSGALPGDCIVLANGNYSGFTITADGTAANPITIRAANQGLAVITSGIIRFNNASYVIVQGLAITTSGSSQTIDGSTRKVAVWFEAADHSRLTRCRLQLSGHTGSTEWVLLSGNSQSNRVDHCEFGPNTVDGHLVWPTGNATIAGVTPNPTVDRGPWSDGLGPFNPNMARYTRIDHNYFHDHLTNVSNGGEAIVLGGIGMTGDYQDTFTTVEYNLFQNVFGDGEMISVKTSSSTIRYNTVLGCGGSFVSRAGNKTDIYGNFMLQAGRASSGGVRIHEKDHRVYNNYIESTAGNPVEVGDGDPYDDPGFSHAQVVRAKIVHNTFVNCGGAFDIGNAHPLDPVDLTLANNLLFNTTVSIPNPLAGWVYSQNIIFPSNPGRTGFNVVDPQLTTVDGLQKLSAGSPAVNAANTNYYSFVADDMDGQARVVPDIGADEFSAAAIVRRPLTTNDVGVNAFEGDFELTAVPGSQSVLPGTTTNISYTVSVLDVAGSNATVTLSITGLPSNSAASFAPPSVNGSGSSTLNVTVSNTAPIGVYTLTITGASTNATNTTAVALLITRPSTNLQWVAPAGGTWDVAGTTNWLNPGAGTTDFFFQGDSVLFGNTGSLTVNIAVTVMPSMITNDATLGRTFSGAGKISGAAGIVKKGVGMLTLSNANDFTGPVTVFGGTIRIGNNSALGATNGFTAITNTGTLDINGIALAGVGEYLTVSGPGAGVNGAIFNSGVQRTDALRYVTLAGDTTFGGGGLSWMITNGGRWDIRNSGGNRAFLKTGGQPHKLTKTGSNQVAFVATDIDENLGDIDIQQGLLGFETSSTSMGNPASNLFVRAGATLSFFNATSQWNKVFTLFGNGGSSNIYNWSGSNTMIGPVTLVGACVYGIQVQALTNRGPIGGSGGLVKAGNGHLVLASTNTYTGNTTLNAGVLGLAGFGSIAASSNIIVNAGTTFDVSGRSDGKLTLAAGQTLRGNGALNGALAIDPGATVSPGTNGIGTLTISGVATLGGTVSMELNRVAATNDVLQAATHVYGGTLSLTNLAGTLASGDSFKLFSASSYSGAFANVLPPMPGSGLAWDLTSLTNGVVRVIPAPRPHFSGAAISGSSIVMVGTNGIANANYFVLASSNLSLPFSNWTRMSTNVFSGNGGFGFSNALDVNSPRQFYLLQLP